MPFNSPYNRFTMARALPEARSGVIEPIMGTDGTMSYRVAGSGEIFNRLSDARAHIQSIGITSRSATLPGAASPLLQQAREHLDPSVSIHVETFNFRSPEQVQEISQRLVRDGTAHGYIVPDQHQMTVARFFQDGREWSAQEISDTFSSRFGASYDFTEELSKMVKRAKMAVSTKRANAAIQDPFIVSIVDDNFRAPMVPGTTVDELTKSHARMYDGISEISSHGIDLMTQANQKNKQDLIRELATTRDPRMRASIESAIRQIDLVIDDMASLKSGGLANIRAENFSITVEGQGNVEPDSAMGRTLENLKSQRAQLKGNVILGRTLDIGNESRRFEERVAIRTHYGNLKFPSQDSGLLEDFSGGFQHGRIYRPRIQQMGRMTLEMHHMTPLWSDMQAMATYPEFFDDDFMKTHSRITFDRMKEDIEELRRGGIPSTIEEMLQGMEKGRFEVLDEETGRFVDDVERLTTQDARNLRRIIESGGDLTANPALRDRLIRVLGEGITKKGMIRMRVPGAFRAEVVSRMYADDDLLRNQMANVGPGSVGLDRSGALVMHEADVIAYHYNFGGFDLDDQLASMLRRTKDGKLQLLSYRNPLSRGEWGSFGIVDEQNFITRMMKGGAWHDSTQRDEFFRILKKHNFDSAEMRAFLDEIIPSAPDTLPPMREPISDRSRVFMDDAPDGLQRYHYMGEKGPQFYEAINTSTTATQREQTVLKNYVDEARRELGPRASQKDVDRLAWQRFETTRLGAVSEATHARGMLGRYINARTLLDNFVASNWEAIEAHGDSRRMLRLFEMETVIDTLTGNVEGINVGDVEDSIQQMQDYIVRQSIELRDQGVGVSPGLMRDRNIDEAMAETFERLRGQEEITFESIFSPNEIDTAMATQEEAREFVESLKGQGFEARIVEQELSDRSTAISDARKIQRSYREAVAGLDSFVDPLEFGDASLDDMLRRGALPTGFQDTVTNNVLRSVMETFDVQQTPEGVVERVAGRRTKDALIALAQDFNAMERAPYSMLDDSVMSQLYSFVAGDTDLEITARSISESRRMVISPGAELNAVFQEAIGQEDFGRITAMDTALQLSEGQGAVSLTDEAFEAVRGMEGPSVLPLGRQLPSLLDPEAYVDMGDGSYSRIGEIAFRRMQGEEEARDILRTITRNYMQSAEAVAQSSGVDSMVAGAFGSKGAARGAHAADAAASVTEGAARTTLGEGVAQLARTTGGRIIGASGLALVGAAAINMFSKRDKDVTLDDIQGPANLPGGNPYTRQERPVRNLTPPGYEPNNQGGITYEVRNSGNMNESLLRDIAGLTGASVFANLDSTGSFEPDLESILRDY